MASRRTQPHQASRRHRHYHHGDLRRGLIDAALALIAEGELGTLSLREVARRAAVSPAAPYHHFRDKTALLAAVAGEGFTALSAWMDAALDAVPRAGARGRLAAIARAYIEFARTHAAHYRVMFLPEVKYAEGATTLHTAASGSFDRLVAAVQAVRPRSTERSARGLAVIVWAAGHGLSSLWNDGLLESQLRLDPGGSFLEVAVDRIVALAAAARRN